MEHRDETEMEAVIWAYIDGTCNAAERAHAEAQMGRDAGWRAKYQELLAVHEGLKNLELQEPSLRFTKNVMEALEREQAAAASPDHGYKHLPWPLAALFLILSGAGLLSAFLAGNGGGPGYIQRYVPAEIYSLLAAVNLVLVLALGDMLIRKRLKGR